MKLRWLRAGCASIAECGGFGCVCEFSGDGNWYVRVRESDGLLLLDTEIRGTLSIAEAACEAWLDQHDKPVWHDATEWLSWAEWRGKRIYLRTEVHMTPGWGAYLHGERHIVTRPSRDEAKAAAEKYVREQTQ